MCIISDSLREYSIFILEASVFHRIVDTFKSIPSLASREKTLDKC